MADQPKQPAAAPSQRPTVVPAPPARPPPVRTAAAPVAPRPVPPPSQPTAAVPPAVPQTRWSFWRLLVVLGELAVLAGILTFLGFSNLGILAEDIPITVLIVLGLVGALLLAFKEAPWSYLTAGILVSLFPILGLLLFMVFILMNPLEGRSFIGVLLIVLGLLMALPAGIRGFRHARRKEHVGIRRGWNGRHGRFVFATVFIVIGAIYAGGLASVSAKQNMGGGADFTPDEVGGQSRDLIMKDFEFVPQTLTVPVNVLTEIKIVNEDSESHTFTYVRDGKEYDHAFLGETRGSVWVLFKDVGTIAFRCVPHSSGYEDDSGMVGTIEVTA